MVGAAILLERDHTDALVLRFEGPQQLHAAVRGGIVHDDELPSSIGLNDDRDRKSTRLNSSHRT